MSWQYIAKVVLKAEGPCANTFAEGNPAGSGDLTLTPEGKTWAALAKGERLELFMGSDLPPLGAMEERKDFPHHFVGTVRVFLARWPAPPEIPQWPPLHLLLDGVGSLTYDLHRKGVAEAIQFECLTPIAGPAFRLVTPEPGEFDEVKTPIPRTWTPAQIAAVAVQQYANTSCYQFADVPGGIVGLVPRWYTRFRDGSTYSFPCFQLWVDVP